MNRERERERRFILKLINRIQIVPDLCSVWKGAYLSITLRVPARIPQFLIDSQV